MPVIEILFVLSGIFFGLTAGIIPSIGIAFTLVILFPFIINLQFDSLIAFYITAYISTFFSNSVIALWAGVAGDTTSYPMLYERKTIIKNNLVGAALKRTAQASFITSIISLCLLVFFVEMLRPLVNFFLGSITSALIFLIMVLMSIFWSGNKRYINFILVIFGLILGLIGYHPHLGHSLLTFGHYYLYSGIPVMPVVIGLYAIPLMFDAFIDSVKIKSNHENCQSFIIPKDNVNFLPIVRGGILGFFIGLIPVIGTSVASNISYFFESKLKNSDSLDKVTSAESANNASAVSVLIPLLTIGVAIIPSEMLVLVILEQNGWKVTDITNATYIKVAIFSFIACVICYWLCVNYVSHLMRIFVNYQKLIIIFFSILLLWGVYIQGFKSLQEIFYLVVCMISVIVGFFLKAFKINPIPLIIAFMISIVGLPVFLRAIQLVRYILLS